MKIILNIIKKINAAAALLICAVLVLAPLTSCTEEEETETPEETASKKIAAYKTDLFDSAETMTDIESISSYLVSWAENKSIECTTDTYGNIIMSVPGTEEYADAPRTVVVCTFDPTQFEYDVNSIAPALFIAKNCSEYGALDVIFTPQTGGDLSGPKTLSASYFPEGSSVFVLSSASAAVCSYNAAGYSSYNFSSAVTYETIAQDAKSEYAAIKVSISGLAGGTPNASISSYFNPIKELGNLLADLKTSAKIFRIASISGGTGVRVNPSSAEVTIVVGKDALSSIGKFIDKEINSIEGRYSDDIPDLEYTYEEVEVPDKVLSESSNNLFISAIYTLLDGIYQKNSNSDATTITNLGKVSLTDEKMIFEATGSSLGAYDLSRLDNDYSTLCSLTGLTFNIVSSHESWVMSIDDEDYAAFISEVKTAQDSFGSDNIEWGDCVQPTAATIISDVAVGCNMVNFVVDENSSEECAGTIASYMAALTHTDEE